MLERAFRTVLAVVVGGLVVLAATGVYLAFYYFPRIGGTPARSHDVVREVHRVCAWATLASGAVLVLLLVVRALASRTQQRIGQRVVDGLVAAALVTSLAITIWTGLRLPWDQIALRAVPVGTNISRYRFLWQGNVRFVLAAGREVSAASLLHTLLLHVIATGAGTLALLLSAWAVVRRSVTNGDDGPAPAVARGELHDEPAAYLS
jgi:quinol-cytochrome oxidoreductase complex cytochrome b subunit